jgi:hypothetical protein
MTARRASRFSLRPEWALQGHCAGSPEGRLQGLGTDHEIHLDVNGDLRTTHELSP